MNKSIEKLEEEKEQLNKSLNETIELLDTLRNTKYRNLLNLQKENEVLLNKVQDLQRKQEKHDNELEQIMEYYESKFSIINEICSQINITIMGGEKSPKDEWIELYMITTDKIMQICKGVRNVENN